MKKFFTLLLVLTGAVCTASAQDWYLRGDFNSWGESNPFTEGQTSITLTAGQTINFKITGGGTWYGYNGNVNYSNCSNLSFSSDGGNCYMIAGEAGTYTFTLNTTGPSITVTYPEYTGTIYFCNNLGWETPYVYILATSYWDNEKGAGSNGRPNGIAMSQVGSTNLWRANCPSGIDADDFFIAFVEGEQDSYNNFWSTKAVYRGDFKTSTPVFVPSTTSSGSFNSTTYYNNGEWHAYPTYTRSVTEGNFGTICLPFAAEVTGATVFKIVSKVMSGTTLTGINLESVDALEAGKAYIFKATGSTLTATYSGSYADASADFGMMGNLSASPVTVAQGKYVVNSNKLRKVTGDAVTVGQYKAYVTLDGISEAASRSSDFISFNEGTTTGIETVSDSQIKTNETYDLQGRRVNITNRQKGLYIVNGKKYIVK